MPRTGTASLRIALSHLLKGPIYHMRQVAYIKKEDASFWIEVCDKKKKTEEWQKFLEGFRGGVDLPCALFYKELMEVFPNAKVILSVRDPKSWYKSVKETIFKGHNDFVGFPLNFWGYLNGMSKNFLMVEKLTKSGQNRFNLGKSSRVKFLTLNLSFLGVFDVIREGEESSVNFFNHWVAEVKNHVPSEKLLIFDVKEGWKPLCEFLNLPVPEMEFPKTNDSKDIQRRFRRHKIRAYVCIFGLPILIAAVVFPLVFMAK